MASSSSTTTTSQAHYYSPCAACKFLRRKCLPGCVFAPYFPPEEPQKFANVHKVFGASNVAKLLNEVLPHQRQDAVVSLAYEAEARIRNPVYGCVGAISFLQKQVQRLQKELDATKARLFLYSCTDFSTPFSSQPQILSPWNHNDVVSANSSSVYFSTDFEGRFMWAEEAAGNPCLCLFGFGFGEMGWVYLRFWEMGLFNILKRTQDLRFLCGWRVVAANGCCWFC